MNVFVTSGGTKVRIDAARYIGNDSEGGFGKTIAAKLLARGHKVTQFHAKGSPTPFSLHFDLRNSRGRQPAVELEDAYSFAHRYLKNFTEQTFFTFEEYSGGLFDLLRSGVFDAVVLAAAVSDYGVTNCSDQKERTRDQMTLELIALPKLISKVRTVFHGTLVGFKMLVSGSEDDFLAAADKSFADNGCDIVFVNNQRGHGFAKSLIASNGKRVWVDEPCAAQSLVEEIESVNHRRTSSA